MGTVDTYRQVVKSVLSQFIGIKYANVDANIQNEEVFDEKRDRYVVMTIGWEGPKRMHHCLHHIDIISGKVWIYRDGTDYGIAKDLLEAGIPKHDIVLAFHPPEVRPYTEFAVA